MQYTTNSPTISYRNYVIGKVIKASELNKKQPTVTAKQLRASMQQARDIQLGITNNLMSTR